MCVLFFLNYFFGDFESHNPNGRNLKEDVFFNFNSRSIV
jgi:hypothetical protein